MYYYVYLRRFDGTSTYKRYEMLPDALRSAGNAFLTENAYHVEITTVAPPVEGGNGIDWLK